MTKSKILPFLILAIFMLSAIDAYQDLWNEENLVDSIAYIFLIALIATLPAFLFFALTKKYKNTKVSFYSHLMSSVITAISLVFWSIGIITGEAPASGAQQMHLVIWPIIIPILSVIIFALIVTLLVSYRWVKSKRLINKTP